MPPAAQSPKISHALLRGPLRDTVNRIARGTDAPRAKERIWVNPQELNRTYIRNPDVTPDFKRRHSGLVLDGDWDHKTEPTDESWKIAACLAHFRDGVPWEETGVYARMQDMIAERGRFDSCQTLEDVEARYAAIDRLFDSIRVNGFQDHSIHRFGTPRLPEGVFVHIDHNGDPIFGAIGNHRLGIARALGLTRIPAQLGVVHPAALEAGALAKYRGERS